jgi:hypothetical protein
MNYTVERTSDGRWLVIDAVTRSPYGQPVSSPQDAQRLMIEAEASANLRRMVECRSGTCSI